MNILNHPLFVILIVVCVVGEWLYFRFYRKIKFNAYEATSNLAIIGIDKTMIYTFGSDGTGLGLWLTQFRILTWDFGLFWNGVITFFAVEFLYYATHWYNHRVNLGWCTHVVHHSPTQMNLTVGYRLGITRFISLGWMIFLPAVLLGFDPLMLAAFAGVVLLYQFFIHTELIPPLGVLENIFNTPSNHRVHHSGDPSHYNKNLGGFTMFFDHIFGTYQKEPVNGIQHYGMLEVMERKNIWHEIIFQWKILLSSFMKTTGVKNKIFLLFRSPESLERRNP